MCTYIPLFNKCMRWASEFSILKVKLQYRAVIRGWLSGKDEINVLSSPEVIMIYLIWIEKNTITRRNIWSSFFTGPWRQQHCSVIKFINLYAYCITSDNAELFTSGTFCSFCLMKDNYFTLYWSDMKCTDVCMLSSKYHQYDLKCIKIVHYCLKIMTLKVKHNDPL